MSAGAKGRPAEILLVEDNLGDVMLTRECLRRIEHPVNLHHVDNGEACLAFLRRSGPYADAPAPDLLLLDLNLPRMDGRQVMAEIAADPQLCHLPVVILTTSGERGDVLHMHRLRCSSYVVKPIDLDRFEEMLACLIEYWFSVATLPLGPAGGAGR